MKTARILLIAIGILSIIAGAFAFKVHRGAIAYCRSTANGAGACTTTLFNFSCIPTFNGTVYCTTVPGAPCTLTASLIIAPQ